MTGLSPPKLYLGLTYREDRQHFPQSHVCVLITDPRALRLGTANYSSVKLIRDKHPDFDPSYVTPGGRHPELPLESFGFYRNAPEYTEATLLREFERGRFHEIQPISHAMLEELQLGALISPHTPKWLKLAIRVQFPHLLRPAGGGVGAARTHPPAAAP